MKPRYAKSCLLAAAFILSGIGTSHGTEFGGGEAKSFDIALSQVKPGTKFILAINVPKYAAANIENIRVITTPGSLLNFSSFSIRGGGWIDFEVEVLSPVTANPSGFSIKERFLVVGIDNITGVYLSPSDATPTTSSMVINPVDNEGTNGNTDPGRNKNIASSFDKGGNDPGSSGEDGGGQGGGNGKDVEIYPNPVDDETNVVTVGEILYRSVQIYDMAGRVQKSFEFETPTNRSLLDLRGMKAGVYMVVVQTNKGAIVKKINKVD